MDRIEGVKVVSVCILDSSNFGFAAKLAFDNRLRDYAFPVRLNKIRLEAYVSVGSSRFQTDSTLQEIEVQLCSKPAHVVDTRQIVRRDFVANAALSFLLKLM